MNTLCLLSQGMTVVAFMIFLISCMVYIYFIVLDALDEDENDRPYNQTVWITIFFIMLLFCLCVSVYCLVLAFQNPQSYVKYIHKKPKKHSMKSKNKKPCLGWSDIY